jgi:hypothetical protein
MTISDNNKSHGDSSKQNRKQHNKISHHSNGEINEIRTRRRSSSSSSSSTSTIDIFKSYKLFALFVILTVLLTIPVNYYYLKFMNQDLLYLDDRKSSHLYQKRISNSKINVNNKNFGDGLQLLEGESSSLEKYIQKDEIEGEEINGEKRNQKSYKNKMNLNLDHITFPTFARKTLLN